MKLTLGLSVKLTLGECLSMGALTLHSLEQTARNLRQVHRKIARKIFYSQKIFPTIPQGDTEIFDLKLNLRKICSNSLVSTESIGSHFRANKSLG